MKIFSVVILLSSIQKTYGNWAAAPEGSLINLPEVQTQGWAAGLVHSWMIQAEEKASNRKMKTKKTIFCKSRLQTKSTITCYENKLKQASSNACISETVRDETIIVGILGILWSLWCDPLCFNNFLSIKSSMLSLYCLYSTF